MIDLIKYTTTTTTNSTLIKETAFFFGKTRSSFRISFLGCGRETRICFLCILLLQPGRRNCKFAWKKWFEKEKLTNWLLWNNFKGDEIYIIHNVIHMKTSHRYCRLLKTISSSQENILFPAKYPYFIYRTIFNMIFNPKYNVYNAFKLLKMERQRQPSQRRVHKGQHCAVHNNSFHLENNFCRSLELHHDGEFTTCRRFHISVSDEHAAAHGE